MAELIAAPLPDPAAAVSAPVDQASDSGADPSAALQQLRQALLDNDLAAEKHFRELQSLLSRAGLEETHSALSRAISGLDFAMALKHLDALENALAQLEE